MAAVLAEIGLAQGIDVAAAFEQAREAQRRRAQRQREHKVLPKLVRGLDEDDISQTIGSRTMHKLFPRRKAMNLLRRSVRDSD
ncbi:MAG: hypothetical protein ACREGR_00625 [Minisyncoccia bacterium]